MEATAAASQSVAPGDLESALARASKHSMPAIEAPPMDLEIDSFLYESDTKTIADCVINLSSVILLRADISTLIKAHEKQSLALAGKIPAITAEPTPPAPTPIPPPKESTEDGGGVGVQPPLQASQEIIAEISGHPEGEKNPIPPPKESIKDSGGVGAAPPRGVGAKPPQKKNKKKKEAKKKRREQMRKEEEEAAAKREEERKAPVYVVLSERERYAAAKMYIGLIGLGGAIFKKMYPFLMSATIAVLKLRVMVDRKSDVTPIHAHILQRFSELLPGMFAAEVDKETGAIRKKVCCTAAYFVPVTDPEQLEPGKWGVDKYIVAYKSTLHAVVIAVLLGELMRAYILVKRIQNMSVPADVLKMQESYLWYFMPLFREDSTIALNIHASVLKDQVTHIISKMRGASDKQLESLPQGEFFNRLVKTTTAELSESLLSMRGGVGGAPPHPAGEKSVGAQPPHHLSVANHEEKAAGAARVIGRDVESAGGVLEGTNFALGKSGSEDGIVNKGGGAPHSTPEMPASLAHAPVREEISI